VGGNSCEGNPDLRRHLQLAVVLGAAALALPLYAQETHLQREGNAWVEVVSGALTSARNLKVSTDFGTVVVRGGSPKGITYTVRKRAAWGTEATARHQFELFNVHAFQKGDFAVLEGECSGSERINVEIAVNVPRDLAVAKVETRGGRVSISDIAGRAEAETSGGPIHLSDIGGDVRAETSGGSIDAGNIGGDLKLETAGGSIVVRSAAGKIYAETAGGSIEVGSATQSAILQTAGGSIQVKKCGGDLKAETAGGSVDIGDVGGGAVLETSGGSIRLASANGLVRAETSGGGIRLNRLTRGVTAKTAAGSIQAEFIASRNNFSDSYLETSVGDVIVYLPADLPVTVRASIDAAMGHKMVSDFPEVKVSSEGGDFGPREIYGQGAINGGGPVLKISTTAGNVELRRGKR
jgi:DUF4097 and DUF4098 domain-containing protein YvlB